MGTPLRRRQHRPISSADTSSRLRREVRDALANPQEVFGYASYGEQFPVLNRLSAGVQKKKWTVLAARPKVGKSMLAGEWVVPIAQQAIAEDAVVRVITLEMTTLAWQRRMAAQMAQINDPMNVRRGFLTQDEQKRYFAALDWLEALPIEYLSNEADLTEEEAMIPGNSPVTYDEAAAFIRGESGSGGGRTFWWLLDHIGLLSDLSQYGDMTTNIYDLATKLGHLAHTTASGLTITHLTRLSVGGEPSIESIGGSDRVGQMADSLMFLWRPYMEAKDLSEADREAIKEGEPALLKYLSRDEGSGMDWLWFDKLHGTFKELDLEPGQIVTLPEKKKGKGK